NLIVTAGRYGEVRFWNPTTATAIAAQSKHSDSFVTALSVSTDGSAMYSSSNELLHWDLRKVPIRSRKICSHGGYPMEDVALLADQRTVAVSCVDKTAGLIDALSREEQVLRHNGRVTRMLALPDGKHLVAVASQVEIKFAASETEATFVVWNVDARKK